LNDLTLRLAFCALRQTLFALCGKNRPSSL
jgi:hypothetical protein